MTVVLIGDKVKPEDIKKASEEYGDYIKITVDIASGAMTIGGEWHADGEKVLLENGSKQENIWGGGIDIKTKRIEYTALINLRPKQSNDSMDLLDSRIKQRFDELVKERFNI